MLIMKANIKILCLTLMLTVCVYNIFSIGATSSGAEIESNDLSGRLGDTVTFSIYINSSPNEIKSLGFDIQYNPAVLRYLDYAMEQLANDLDFFGVNLKSVGTVRVGGFGAGQNTIWPGASGKLVSLVFEVIGHDDSQIRLTHLTDDMKTWSARSGSFTGDHEFNQAEEQTVPTESGEILSPSDNTPSGDGSTPLTSHNTGSDVNSELPNASDSSQSPDYNNQNTLSDQFDQVEEQTDTAESGDTLSPPDNISSGDGSTPLTSHNTGSDVNSRLANVSESFQSHDYNRNNTLSGQKLEAHGGTGRLPGRSQVAAARTMTTERVRGNQSSIRKDAKTIPSGPKSKVSAIRSPSDAGGNKAFPMSSDQGEQTAFRRYKSERFNNEKSGILSQQQEMTETMSLFKAAVVFGISSFLAMVLSIVSSGYVLWRIIRKDIQKTIKNI